MNTVQAHVQSVLKLITASSMTVWYIWGFQSTLFDLTGRTEAWVGDTSIEMVSHSEASCSVKGIKVVFPFVLFIIIFIKEKYFFWINQVGILDFYTVAFQSFGNIAS